jgi:glucose-1-phosphate thymidylyltransferase
MNIHENIRSTGLSLDSIHESMKPTGILLLAGLGTRLRPLTDVVNKHLLPIYDKPMALHSLEFFERSGIHNVIAVCNEKNIDDFAKLFRNRPNMHVTFVVQEKSNGTAAAIKLCEDLCKSHTVATLWGDNLFEYTLKKSVSHKLGRYDARLHLARVTDPEHYAVVDIKHDTIQRITEKPNNPNSNIVYTGFILFSDNIFNTIESITPNKKGEQDIIGAIKIYQQQNTLDYRIITGQWMDMGVTFESLFRAAQFVRSIGINKSHLS